MITRAQLTQLKRWVQRTVFALTHRGNAVECVICGWKGAEWWRAYGVRCPRCSSLPRHRLLPYSIEYFGLPLDGQALLHIAPAASEQQWVLDHHQPGLYLSLDIYGRPVANLVGDVRALPLADDCIDLAITWHVLEHIRDDRLAIAESLRVLKPGGAILVSVPIYPAGNEVTIEDPSVPPEDQHRLYGHWDHVRACGRDYSRRFEEAGFVVRELNMKKMVDGLGVPHYHKYGLSGAHIVWCCIKPPIHQPEVRTEAGASAAVR